MTLMIKIEQSRVVCLQPRLFGDYASSIAFSISFASALTSFFICFLARWVASSTARSIVASPTTIKGASLSSSIPPISLRSARDMPPCRFTIRPGTRRIGPNRSLQPSFAVSCATSRVCNVSLPARRLSSRLAVLPPGVQGGQGHTRLHQHSSSKPTAHSGFAPAISISRSRLLFSFLQWLRRGDPALGPHPHRTERRRDKVARMVSPETRSGLNRSSKATSRRPSPKSTSCSRARIPSESGGASPSKPRRLPPREGGLHALGAREGGREGFEAALVDEEGADGVPHPLRSAPEVLGDLRRRVPAGARQKDLAPAHHESVSRAQSGFEALTLVFRQFPNENWRFHATYYSPLHTTLSEDALGATVVAATDLSLVGTMAFVGASVAVMAAIMTVVVLWSGAHDETTRLGGHDYSESPPNSGEWPAGGCWDGGGGGDGGGWSG